MNIPPPPPPLVKKPCALCERGIKYAIVTIEPLYIKNKHGIIVASLQGGDHLIETVDYCPVCGRELKEVTQ